MVRNPLPSPGNYLSWFKKGRNTVGKPEIWAESTDLKVCSVQIDHQAAVNTFLVIRIGFWAQEHLQIRLGSQGEVREDESLEEELQRQNQRILATGMRTGIGFWRLKCIFWGHTRVQLTEECRQVKYPQTARVDCSNRPSGLSIPSPGRSLLNRRQV